MKIQNINLYSIRILPHHQDTGGFFVAVLEKVKPLPGEKVYVETDQPIDTSPLTATSQRIRQVCVYNAICKS